MTKHLRKIWDRVKESIFKDSQVSESSITALGIIGLTCHPLYWFFWTYAFPQSCDLWPLRFSAAAFCGIFLFKNYWPEGSKKYFYQLWFLCIAYALPFIFTVHLILNQFSDIWLMCETAMFFMVDIFLPNFFLMTLNLVFGIGCAIIYCFLIKPDLLVFSVSHLKYLPIFAFASLAGFIFSYSSILGIRTQEKIKSHERAKVLRSLAGSIVHEIRNPLNTINLIGIQIGKLLSQGARSSAESRERLMDLTADISETVTDANNIINIILNDMSEKKISRESLSCLEIDEILPDIVGRYGYRGNEEKSRVRLVVDGGSNFKFFAVEERFSFIIYNLIKNALYYLEKHPELVVLIGCEKEKRKYGRQFYNVIYVQDNGPGIAPDAISKLFDDFYTTGKKEGTGLGLSFCKRNMQLFGGDIICESEVGEWTKFSLLFPVIEEEERKIREKMEMNLAKEKMLGDEKEVKARELAKIYREELEKKKSELRAIAQYRNYDVLQNKNVLIADDDAITLKHLAEYLKDLGAVRVDMATNGRELVDLFIKSCDNENRKSDYAVIITDIGMPILDGSDAAREIRIFEKQHHMPPIAIVAATGNEENRLSFYKCGINDCFIKGEGYDRMLRVIGLWVDDV